jgi:hypothetical protein
MKGRNYMGKRGPQKGQEHLDPKTVLAIFSCKGRMSGQATAQRYHTSPAHVSNIWNKKVWKHLLDPLP